VLKRLIFPILLLFYPWAGSCQDLKIYFFIAKNPKFPIIRQMIAGKKDFDFIK